MIYTQETPNRLHVFISASRAEYDICLNNTRHLLLLKQLQSHGFNYKDTFIGCYREEGQDEPNTELTVRVTIDKEDLPTILYIAELFNQDAVLVVNSVTYTAQLVFKGGATENIGTMTKVSKCDIKGECFTYNFETQEYWECL